MLFVIVLLELKDLWSNETVPFIDSSKLLFKNFIKSDLYLNLYKCFSNFDSFDGLNHHSYFL